MTLMSNYEKELLIIPTPQPETTIPPAVIISWIEETLRAIDKDENWKSIPFPSFKE